MPRLTNALPKYRKHKASGQAFVELSGKRIYLGPHGTKLSRTEYDRLTGTWQANGRQLNSVEKLDALSIVELINAYRKHAKTYYVKNGRSTGTAENLRPVMRLLRTTYRHCMVVDFGPLALKNLQQKMVNAGQARKYVNENVDRIRRMFKWAASNELIPYETYQRLTTVDGLRKGRTKARENPPVLPISDETVETTLLHLSQIVADMVRLQRLTGCRPGEICVIRPCDVETADDVWCYRPEAHKTEHHDRDRIIPIGPRGQDILRPYLLRDKEVYCFSPQENEQTRLSARHSARVTPPNCGNRPGTNKKRNRKRPPRDRYNRDSYRRAVQRACDKAFPPPQTLSADELKKWQTKHRWNPNQLRHSAATEIRKQFGLEAAQVALGHSNANVTQIYAQRDIAKAIDVMRLVG